MNKLNQFTKSDWIIWNGSRLEQHRSTTYSIKTWGYIVTLVLWVRDYLYTRIHTYGELWHHPWHVTWIICKTLIMPMRRSYPPVYIRDDHSALLPLNERVSERQCGVEIVSHSENQGYNVTPRSLSYQDYLSTRIHMYGDCKTRWEEEVHNFIKSICTPTYIYVENNQEYWTNHWEHAYPKFK